ncbi:MAG TPA: dihydroxyacetone kinase subunit DhaL [Rubrobacteraceae bacterium]|nr:dihydroxyacetone kinase subunit DhaL [Rubrobacteraceae bacterium]
MRRMLNDATSFKEEMVEGFVAAYRRFVRRIPDASGVMAVGAPKAGKVSVLIGGGSGHYPAFCGVVGQGLADGAVIGDVFTSPSAEQVYRCTKALDGGAGVLLSYGNYAGDVLNFDMAQARCRDEGMDIRTVIVTDDVASAPKGKEHERRGVAGDLYVFKVAGASAARGDDMDGVEQAAQRANANTRSIGIAFAGCTLPGQTEPLFTVEPGMMEVGMGVHGEPGIRTAELLPARGIAELLVDTILEDAPEGAGSRAAVMLDGLGSTKYEELFVLFGDVNRILKERGIEVHEPLVGELVTSLDMAGCSLTLMWLDDELQELHDAPAATPAFSRGSLDLPDEADHAVSVAAGAQVGSESGGDLTESGAGALDALERVLGALRDAEQELGRLDAAAGDGDHGAGMVRGMGAAVEAARAGGGSAGEVLSRAGMAFSGAAGGASGALYGAWISAVGQSLGDDEKPDAAAVHRALKDSLATLEELGKAKPGDKTMIDTLEPFVRSLGEAAKKDASVAAAWSAALPAAEEGANSTAGMISARGRASKLGERSRGHKDPGAVSMFYVLRAAGEAISEGGGR